MKTKITSLFLVLLILVATLVIAQEKKDKAIYVESKPGFYHNHILKTIAEENQATNTVPKQYFSMDFSSHTLPKTRKEFTEIWHQPTVSQGKAGTCWSYSAISFFESELYRLKKEKIQLSQAFIVYYEYLEKAARYIEERGNSYLNEGSEVNGVKRMMKKYGIVPLEAYTGLTYGQSVHNHTDLIREIKEFLEKLKEMNAWDKEWALQVVASILDKYMGSPPDNFNFKGKEYTPKSFLSDYLGLIPDDYYIFISFTNETYYQRTVLKEDDNWWNSDDYYNIPLDEFMKVFDDAVRGGYSISLCGDVSEPGIDRYTEVAMIPSFDIPSAYINADARQFRWENKSTTNDHCIHVVGYKDMKNGRWYLIKDSGSGAFDGPNKGYRFFHEDYIKLKMVNYMLHKDASRTVLDKCIK